MAFRDARGISNDTGGYPIGSGGVAWALGKNIRQRKDPVCRCHPGYQDGIVRIDPICKQTYTRYRDIQTGCGWPLYLELMTE